MLRIIKWLGIVSALLLVFSAFIPWVYIESRNITVTGLHAAGTNFGSPAYFHFAMVACFLTFTLIPRIWAKRWNLLVVALNLGWAIRNFLIIPACEGGECPVKKTGLYLSLITSVIILIAALFPDMKVPSDKPGK